MVNDDYKSCLVVYLYFFSYVSIAVSNLSDSAVSDQRRYPKGFGNFQDMLAVVKIKDARGRKPPVTSSAWRSLRFRLLAVERWFFLRCCLGGKQLSFRGQGRGWEELTIWPWSVRGLTASPRRR